MKESKGLAVTSPLSPAVDVDHMGKNVLRRLFSGKDLNIAAVDLFTSMYFPESGMRERISSASAEISFSL